MDEKLQLTENQERFLKEKMGVSDLGKVRIIFEVDSFNTSGVKEVFSTRSTKLSFTLCPCADGGWSWLCC